MLLQVGSDEIRLGEGWFLASLLHLFIFLFLNSNMVSYASVFMTIQMKKLKGSNDP